MRHIVVVDVGADHNVVPFFSAPRAVHGRAMVNGLRCKSPIVFNFQISDSPSPAEAFFSAFSSVRCHWSLIIDGSSLLPRRKGSLDQSGFLATILPSDLTKTLFDSTRRTPLTRRV